GREGRMGGGGERRAGGYGGVRRDAAAELNIRVSTLDEEVAKRRERSGKARRETEVIEPSVDPVDGPALFEDLRKVFTTYMAVLSPPAVVAMVLWVLHTYACDAADCSPILAITSPRPRCGKTRLLSILETLVFNCMLSSSVSAAALYRMIDKLHPTVLVDECDNLFTDKNPNPDVRAIFNAGNYRGSKVLRCVGDAHE